MDGVTAAANGIKAAATLVNSMTPPRSGASKNGLWYFNENRDSLTKEEVRTGLIRLRRDEGHDWKEVARQANSFGWRTPTGKLFTAANAFKLVTPNKSNKAHAERKKKYDSMTKEPEPMLAQLDEQANASAACKDIGALLETEMYPATKVACMLTILTERGFLQDAE